MGTVIGTLTAPAHSDEEALFDTSPPISPHSAYSTAEGEKEDPSSSDGALQEALSPVEHPEVDNEKPTGVAEVDHVEVTDQEDDEGKVEIPDPDEAEEEAAASILHAATF